MLVRHVDATQANMTLTPTPTTVVFLRWGFNRFPNVTYQLASQGIDLTKLGFPQSLVSQLPYDAFPAITMSDLPATAPAATRATHYYSHSFSGSVSKFMGRHNLKTGFDYRAIHDAGRPDRHARRFQLQPGFTSASATSTVLGTGASLASMLLGFPSAGSVTTSHTLENHVNYYGFFVQDDFRVTNKLTLNFGLRYEYETGMQSSLNTLIVGFDPKTANPDPERGPRHRHQRRDRIRRTERLRHARRPIPNRDKFSPRVGFA